MKKYWRFLNLASVLVLIMATIIGVSRASAQTVCSPATPISGPFTKDGLGTFCWQATSLCDHINSWNMSPALSINGTSYSNVFAFSSSIPPLNGGYTITYNSTSQFAHFEIDGPCGGSGPTSTPTATFSRTPTQVIAVSTTPALTATRTRTATSGPSLTATQNRTATPTITRTITLSPTASATSEPYYVNIALASNFPVVYIGGNDVMATVSTNIQNATFSIIVIDTATGLEQSQTNPILTPAHPASQQANQALGNLANFTLNGVRPGTVFLRATVTGQMCTPTCGQGSISKDSANITVVSGPTPTRTMTPTRTLTPVVGPCSPIDATIVAPFVFDGIGNFCWQLSGVTSSINSFNTSSLNVNGISYTNMFASISTLPPKINGFWYITYIGTFTTSHFDAK